jgi:hypothetical protein
MATIKLTYRENVQERDKGSSPTGYGDRVEEMSKAVWNGKDARGQKGKE